MTKRHRITLTTTAAGFLDSFLLGNGELGATIAGTPGTESIDLNVDSLWSGGPIVAPHDPPLQVVASVRAAVRAGDFLEADRLAESLQSEHYTESFQPVGRLLWSYDADRKAGGAEQYERTLDLADAVVTTRYRVDEREVVTESFVSGPDRVLIMTASGGIGGDGEIDFQSPHRSTVRREQRNGVRWLVASGRVPAKVIPVYVDDADPIRYATDEPDADGLVDAGMGFALAAATMQTPSGLRLVAASVTGFRGWNERPSADLAALEAEAEQRVRDALEVDPIDLTHRHIEDHRAYFDRVDLDLSASPDTANAEHYFDLGRYLLISSSRPGGQAANLQGIWNVDMRPSWSSNYTTDINVQMNYWHADTTALS